MQLIDKAENHNTLKALVRLSCFKYNFYDIPPSFFLVCLFFFKTPNEEVFFIFFIGNGGAWQCTGFYWCRRCYKK